MWLKLEEEQLPKENPRVVPSLRGTDAGQGNIFESVTVSELYFVESTVMGIAFYKYVFLSGSREAPWAPEPARNCLQ